MIFIFIYYNLDDMNCDECHKKLRVGLAA